MIQPTSPVRRSYGWLAVILAILLLIVTYLWAMARNDLREATSRFQGDITSYSTALVQKCKITATTTASERALCEHVFDGFSETFKEYGKALVAITSSTSLPVRPSTSTDPTSTPPLYLGQ